MIVESGQTCDLKCADDFFGLLSASQERKRNELSLIRTNLIPEMCELRARLSRGRVTVAQNSRCSRHATTRSVCMASANGDDELKLAPAALLANIPIITSTTARHGLTARDAIS